MQRAVTRLLEQEAQLADRWLRDHREPPAVAAELLRGVIRSLGRQPGGHPDVEEPATALGVLRAQQGRSSSGLVEEIVALRGLLWGQLAAEPQSEGDLGALLLHQQQVSEAVDGALRRATAAYVEESTRVLAHRATRDALTGLLNRAAFDEALRTAIKAGIRSEAPSLILLDLDKFKMVNDTLGHLQGDDVLVRIGAAVEASVRGGDVAARLGGDEFAVVLAETTERNAVRVARRILKRVERDDELRGLEVPVGVSIGVGRLDVVTTADELFSVTDAALYRAKDAGGGTIEIGRTAPLEQASA